MIDIQYDTAIVDGRKVSRVLKTIKIVNEVKILWRLVAVGNG